MKIRTYGVSTEQAEKVAEHVFADFYLRAASRMENNPEIGKIVEMMTEYPTQCRMLIISTLVFAIGNFDRIEKAERWGTLTKDGDIDTETLEVFDPKFVV